MHKLQTKMKAIVRRVRILVFGKVSVLMSELPDGHPLKRRHFLPVYSQGQIDSMLPEHREALAEMVKKAKED